MAGAGSRAQVSWILAWHFCHQNPTTSTSPLLPFVLCLYPLEMRTLHLTSFHWARCFCPTPASGSVIIGYRESGCMGGEEEGRPLCWSETCRAGSLRHFYFFVWGPKCSPEVWCPRTKARSLWGPYYQACCYDIWFYQC